MKDKFILYYCFTEGAYYGNASHFMINNLQEKLAKYLGK